MNWNGKKVMVFGTGISGMGAARLLEDVGAGVVLYDGNEKLDKAQIEAKLPKGSKAQVQTANL